MKSLLLEFHLCLALILSHLCTTFNQDEKEIQKTAFKQYRVLRTAPSFRYGYKLVVSSSVYITSGSGVFELSHKGVKIYLRF